MDTKEYLIKKYHKHYGKDNVCELIGKKGDLIIEDSRGYHKGKPVLKDDRLILEIQFTDTLLYKKINILIYTLTAII